jgi:hypothetical protein
MRSAVSRIFETRAGRAPFRSLPRLRVVPRPPFPLPAALERWEVLVLVLMILVLVGVGRDGVDLTAIPLTGWMHP